MGNVRLNQGREQIFEVEPVVVPKERDYAAAKDAECGSGKAERVGHGAWRLLKA